jgi:alkylation response protein AidB-like acyl-CoA dehydrogenase
LDFGLSEEQEMLRRSARVLLEKQCPPAMVRRMMDDQLGYAPDLWKTMADLGWVGLVIPESFDGAGLSYVDMAVLLEETGRVLLPAPFIPTVLFAEAINRAGSEHLKNTLLPKIASGELTGTLAHLEPSGALDGDGIAMVARPSGGRFILEGTKLFVNEAHAVDYLLVAARSDAQSRGESGITLFALERTRPGIAVTVLDTMDRTRKVAEVRFEEVEASQADVVGKVGEGWKPLSQVIDRGKVSLAAEMVGGASKVLDMAVAYAKTREQFGRPIGSYQAIQHKCANMLVDIESARSAVYYAAWAVSQEVPEAPLAAALAKAAASDAYRRATADGIQIHGGIGFTWEHDVHLYFKRAKSSEFTFGDATYNREIVAQLIGL